MPILKRLILLGVIWTIIAFRPHSLMAATSEDQSGEVRRLISAAKDRGEGQLDLSWFAGSMGGHAGLAKFETLFNRMYGTKIKVNFTPGPSMPDMTARVAQEVAAGQKSTTDILLATETHYATIVDRGMLEEYDYAKLSPRIRKEFVAPRNIGVQIAGSGVPGVAYNTNFVTPADAPKKLEDVLKPKWKGKIASSQEAAYFDRVAMRPEWGAEKMKAFLRKLSDHIGGLIVIGDMTRINSGEFIMMVLAGHTQFLREKAKGAPLGFVLPEDAAIMGFLYLGVPRNSTHPNLSKLFINTVVSDEGQKLLYEFQITDHPTLPGSQSAAELSGLKAKGIQPLYFDVKFVAEHPEIRQLNNEIRNILRQKVGG